jgi:hypothetical protein
MRLALCLSLALVSSGCLLLPRGGEAGLLPDGRPRPTLVAEPHAITLDGDLSDWQGIKFVTVTPQNGVFDLESKPTDSAADISYRFAVCHDDEALYVAVETTDDTLSLDDTATGQTHALAWQDDAVEVFIDGNRNRAPHARDKNHTEYPFGGEFSLVANGAATSNCTGWPDSFGKPDYWQGATSCERLPDGSWKLRYEYRLTWRVMGGKVRPGDRIGFTIGIQDDDDGENRDHALYWLGLTPHCWKDEAGWGDVYLKP